MVFYFTADAKDPKDGEDYIVYMARLPASRGRSTRPFESVTCGVVHLGGGQVRERELDRVGLEERRLVPRRRAEQRPRLPAAPFGERAVRAGRPSLRGPAGPHPRGRHRGHVPAGQGELHRGLQEGELHGRLHALGEFAQGRDTDAGGRGRLPQRVDESRPSRRQGPPGGQAHREDAARGAPGSAAGAPGLRAEGHRLAQEPGPGDARGEGRERKGREGRGGTRARLRRLLSRSVSTRFG